MAINNSCKLLAHATLDGVNYYAYQSGDSYIIQKHTSQAGAYITHTKTKKRALLLFRQILADYQAGMEAVSVC